MNNTKIRKITVTGMLLAIMLLFNVFPIGFIPLPAFNATLMHIPVLVGLFSEGLGVGVILGAAFGISSLIKAYVALTATSFAFQNPLFSIPPRVLFPIVAWAVALLIMRLIGKFKEGRKTALHSSRVVGSFVGTLTNTVLVLGGMRFFFLDQYAANILKLEITPQIGAAVTTALVAVGSTQGLAEAALAAVLVPLICAALDTAFNKEKLVRKP
ncbi:MAG: ECF transporter S component [Oscillospiraceae bacterium]|jgi:uncharacterized membrane protein|nr:ECF transporter S component [Oscillospiraceae bacterium]